MAPKWDLRLIHAIALLVAYSNAQNNTPPNIIFFMADDLGWNDVSYHGMREIYTPNIDTLAAFGAVLNNYYTLPVCTPSRAALMTGLYPIKTGLQHYVIPDATPGGLSQNFKTLPARLKDIGYITRMVGKWHLGFSLRDYTPLSHGFDSHYGYWTGILDYFQYTSSDQAKGSMFRGAPRNRQNTTLLFSGKDIWNDYTPVRNTRGQYATDLFTENAVKVIREHDTINPLFLYMSHLAVHRGNPYLPVRAPEKYTRRYSYIRNSTRRNFAGALYALDQSLGIVMEALLQKNMLKNTIIVFASDNGAQITSNYLTGGSNFPLRGEKNTNWEGGIRVPSFVWGLNVPKGISDSMMHEIDWLPTLYYAAGGNLSRLGQLDGVNQWRLITDQDTTAVRTGFLINYDTVYNTSGYREGDYKLVLGNYTYEGGSSSPWRQDPGRNPAPEPRPTTSRVLQVLRDFYGQPDLTYNLNVPQINCGGPNPTNFNDAECTTSPCLFNIAEDPCEYRNIAAQNPLIVQRLTGLLTNAKGNAVPPLSQMRDYIANPLNHCGFWDNWQDSQQSATFCRRG